MQHTHCACMHTYVHVYTYKRRFGPPTKPGSGNVDSVGGTKGITKSGAGDAPVQPSVREGGKKKKSTRRKKDARQKGAKAAAEDGSTGAAAGGVGARAGGGGRGGGGGGGGLGLNPNALEWKPG